MKQLNAFVARSFAPYDEQHIRPVLDFLDTFRKAGFFWETAESAEVESVSEKVRRIIDEKDVFIGFFTKRHPVYNLTSKFSDARRILFGSIRHQVWSAPAWVLQESGYALCAKKELILLREPGVEVFGLQGDLEYIPFDPENPSQIFPKLSEMINGLIAKAAGTEVRMIITEKQDETQVAIEASATEPTPETPKDDTSEPNIYDRWIEMYEARIGRDIGKIDEAWKAGTDQIADGNGGELDQLAWNCLYNESRFEAGVATGLETLRLLRAENSTRPEPIAAMARCLSHAKEFEGSAGLFQEAANLQKGEAKVRSLMNAAKGYAEIKNYEPGKKAIELALSLATGELREEAISVRYQLLKDSGDKHLAFASAEAALHENPQLPIRFVLGLDYHRQGLNGLALYHFKFLHDRNGKDSSSLHNLALLCSECQLPIFAVDGYRKAFAMGETLSAANLGFKYLDSGMAEEARTLIDNAMTIDNHVPNVEACLAEITQRREIEQKRELETLELANTDRSLFLAIGRAMEAGTPPVEGRWKFPFGEMPITLKSNRIVGSSDISTEESGISRLLGGARSVRTETYTLEGRLVGATCEFQLTIARKDNALPRLSALSLLAPNTKSGFITFASDGRSGTYVELSDDKLGKPEAITKVG